jgi:Flp pilus assembly protein TadB
VRPAVTATTGGAGNVPVSILEDIISTLLSIVAAVMPVIIAVILVLVGALIVWWIWRRINRQRASN